LRALFSGSELIFASSVRRASILEVARASLTPFMQPERQNIDISGDWVSVSEQTAAGLALAFHELATNALKYGALKAAEGRVKLLCRAEPRGQRTAVTVEWKEMGGEPLQSAPARKGFGKRVIEASLGGEAERSVTMNFERDGLRCRFQFEGARDAIEP
jgi:two-component sensor histidine kinase